MDERDYKAMNDKLKKERYVIIEKNCIPYGGFTKVITECGGTLVSQIWLKSMEEYASQFKKQLKEKDKQLTKSNEMNERLAGQIGLFLNFGGKEHLEEALEQYQNSKK